MMGKLACSVILALCGLVASVVGTEKTINADGSMTFKSPELTEEEGFSNFMPGRMRCDACVAIAYQLYDKFTEFNRIQKHYKFNLPESEVIDITEAVCTTKTFESYGYKQVDGVSRLAGDGIEASNVPAMMQGGGKWPGRLMDMCEQFMGNIGEMEVYNAYKKNPKSRKQFEQFLCYGTGQLGECAKMEKEMEEKGIKKDEL